MLLTQSNEWGSIVTSVADGTQPSTTYGTSIAPGTSNAYGSYASVLAGASLTSDAYAIEVIASSTYTNATDRGVLVTIGFDPAGGTSFSGLGGVSGNEINHLWCTGAYSWYTNLVPFGGARFLFPLFIKAGTSIGAKAQTNDAAAGTCYVAVKLWCQPKRPELVRAGSFVRTFGVTTASTTATAITQGTASEGSWTSVGTAADSLWYLETGLGAKTNAGVNGLSHSDVAIGDGSNKRVVLRDLYTLTNDNEASFKIGSTGAHCDVKSGDGLYVRSQATAAQTGFSAALYGVGG